MTKSYQAGIAGIHWLVSPRSDVEPVLQYGLRPINDGALDWFDVQTEVAAPPATSPVGAEPREQQICSECGCEGCNGECSGDGAMGD